ncbi:DGQHR domain-containing protein [Paenibacillus thiaminolyticus]|uniref:DGQHR domain-containing protein n=3 Tax=Paenibacillus thiaminolyticus TaxID=49283 RepID=A0AAP9IZP8_PANTH|nr:DGQHR domain-containing protein [Paenibacillus thiaminolyticus]MCY9604503.1 DGQHR domain-containing protein [Paenibacillus thiaminolyticus]MCY9610944.1 DGQHR domain-containing protein [Paenibacillus thiaminolyticus]MCY9616823.1 DGQHR domain-containing protein [Paenibacillus thiaminolyticus]MCY9622449.1 DGQHR domain-containing protein [Paenibacillus thiaminolyticus]MCY9623059.1 DGQHR domain-containing protein [Paenibacillus thiaminolyticus]
MIHLAKQYVIENVLQYKMRGKVAYQSYLPAFIALQITYVKPYDHSSGKGYQRPADTKRVDDFASYLSKGEDALFTPILINCAGNWEFSAYSKERPSFGRLICKSKASLMDGQHRIGGIKRYVEETNSEINIPFMAFHYLDDDEEIKLFDTINTKAKGISSSLSKFLKRESDELSWMATELVTRSDSPFYNLGSITGKRTKGRHVTLQNLYRIANYFLKDSKFGTVIKDEKLGLILTYFNQLRELYPDEWSNYKEHRLTHIVCLDALAMAGSRLLNDYKKDENTHVDYQGFVRAIKRLRKIDWSIEGPFKYLKGINGSKTLSKDLYEIMASK